MQNFTPVARTAWSTDDGKTTFCVPMASVIHGFIYNKDLLSKAGVTPPSTVDEFFVALNKVKAGGRVVPLALGTKDGWETASMGYQNIGPNYYKGEEGRAALLNGQAKLTDPQWVEPFRMLAKWKPYLGGRLRIANLSGQPEPVHARARRHLSGWLVGDLGFRETSQVQDGRVSSPRAQGGRQVLHLRSS